MNQENAFQQLAWRLQLLRNKRQKHKERTGNDLVPGSMFFECCTWGKADLAEIKVRKNFSHILKAAKVCVLMLCALSRRKGDACWAAAMV